MWLWRRQRGPEPQPEGGPGDEPQQSEGREQLQALIDDVAAHRLSIGLLIAAVDGDETAVRELLAGLPAADLIEVAGACAGLVTSIACVRGAPRDVLRDSLQEYAIGLAGA